jgi:SAM-dependent methyltransferase
MTRGRRLLDLGGGVGFFTERALEQGWDASTLDISPRIAERAAVRVGADRSLTEVPAASQGSFDVVTMWCVVAHTRDPEHLIETARTALAPKGVLWLTTPNSSFQKPYASVRKSLRRELDFGRDDHVGHFTPEALERILSKGEFADTKFHFRGITETCVAAGSHSRPLVGGKRWWNRLASWLLRFHVNVMSELQVTARRRTTG